MLNKRLNTIKDSISVEFLVYLVIFFVPLIFAPELDNVFELPKSFFLNFTVSFLIAVFVFNTARKKVFTFNVYFSTLVITLYFLLIVLSYFYSKNKYYTNDFFIYNLVYFFWFLIITNIKLNKNKKKLFLNTLIISACITALYGVLQHFKIDFIEWEDPNVIVRNTATLGNPDFLSAFLAVNLIISIYFFLGSEKFEMLPYFVSSLLIFTAMLFTYARGGWVSFLIGLFILIITLLVNKYFKIVLKLFLLLVVFLIIFFLASRQQVTIDNKKTNILNRITSVANLQYPSILIRKYLWKDTLLMIKEKPFLGWGINTFTYAFPKYRSSQLFQLAGRTNLPEHPHNEYLFILQGIGFVGFFIFMWMCVLSLMSCKKIQPSELPLSLIIKISIVVILIQNVFYYLTVTTTLLFFSFLAISTIQSQKKITVSFNLNFSRLTIGLLKIAPLIIFIFLILKISILALADYYYRQGTYKQNENKKYLALKDFVYAVNLNPRNIFYPQSLASLYFEFGTLTKKKRKLFFTKALEQYKNLILFYPETSFLYAGMARIYFQEGTYFKKENKSLWKSSLNCYNKSLNLDKNNPTYLNERGVIYLNQKKYNSAIKDFKKAVAIDKTYIEPYANLGVAYQNLKNKKLAYKYIYYANKLNPQFIDPLIKLAMAEIVDNNLERAKKILLYCKKREPLNKSVKELLIAIEKMQKDKFKTNKK